MITITMKIRRIRNRRYSRHDVETSAILDLLYGDGRNGSGHGFRACGKTRASYQRIALAIP